MKRIGSVREVDDVQLELPAGAAPYEEFDFQPYVEEARSEEELRRTWRVFTKVKDVLDNGRRLENASWRLWFKERSKAGVPPPNPEPTLSHLEQYDLSLDQNLRQAEEDTDRIVGDMFAGVGQRFQQERARVAMRQRAQRARALFELADKHGLSDAVLDDVLAWVMAHVLPQPLHGPPATPAAAAAGNSAGASESATTGVGAGGGGGAGAGATGGVEAQVDDAAALLPANAQAARDLLADATLRPRPRAAAFCHSLERNAQNIFLLYLVKELHDRLSFEVVSAKEGPMRGDYDALGMPVTIVSARSPSYARDVRAVLQTFRLAIANSIMTTEVVAASHELRVPCLWVVHEAWPRDQFDFFAREVFHMTYLSGAAIVDALRNAPKVVFPTEVQRRCYADLVPAERSRVIYNGVPLASINTFRTTRTRLSVRQELGLAPDDIVLVQVGTVCQRKAQLITCQAFAELYCGDNDDDDDALEHDDRGSGSGSEAEAGSIGKRLKLLLVGARYSRGHEVEYIEECRQTLEAVGAERATHIVEAKKNVLPYYLAADIVLCPSLSEVLPLAICEAMAFERAVIASRVDGIPEAITHEQQGLLVEPGNVAELFDAIHRLAADEPLRARLGEAGRKRVLEQFSFETMSRTYCETIEKDLGIDLGAEEGVGNGEKKA